MWKATRTLLGLAALGFTLGAAPLAHAQVYPNIPANTVLGRLGAGQSGPLQAIPFTALSTNLPLTVGGTPIINGTPGCVFYDASSVLGNNCVISISGNTVLVESVGVTPTPLTVRYTNLAPTGIDTATGIVTDCLGNNSTFIGCSNGFFSAGDDATVTTGTKGVLYGLQLAVKPLIARNNSPYDDADGLIVGNNSPNGSAATEAIVVTAGSGFSANTFQWGVDVYAAASAGIAFAIGSGMSTTFNYGVDACYGGTCPIFNNAAFRATNNVPAIVARNAAGNADVEIARVNSSNVVVLANGGAIKFGSAAGLTSLVSEQLCANNTNSGASCQDASAALSVASAASQTALNITGQAANLYVDYAGGGNTYIDATTTYFRTFGGTAIAIVNSSGLSMQGSAGISSAGTANIGGITTTAGLINTAAAPTVSAGQVGLGSTVEAAGSGTCPSGTVGGQTVAGCTIINVAGTTRYQPYF